MENENKQFDPEYYSDEYVDKETARAVDFMKKIFNDDLKQIEYLKLRQIAKEIQSEKSMNIEDTYGRPMFSEIAARFIHDNYGQDFNMIADMTDGDWEKDKQHLQIARKHYLDDEHEEDTL